MYTYKYTSRAHPVYRETVRKWRFLVVVDHLPIPPYTYGTVPIVIYYRIGNPITRASYIFNILQPRRIQQLLQSRVSSKPVQVEKNNNNYVLIIILDTFIGDNYYYGYHILCHIKLHAFNILFRPRDLTNQYDVVGHNLFMWYAR